MKCAGTEGVSRLNVFTRHVGNGSRSGSGQLRCAVCCEPLSSCPYVELDEK